MLLSGAPATPEESESKEGGESSSELQSTVREQAAVIDALRAEVKAEAAARNSAETKLFEAYEELASLRSEVRSRCTDICTNPTTMRQTIFRLRL